MYVTQLIQLRLTCTAIVPPLFPRVEDTTHARSVYLEAFGATFSYKTDNNYSLFEINLCMGITQPRTTVILPPR